VEYQKPTFRESIDAKSNKIAIVYATGTITTGDSNQGGIGEDTLGSSTLVKALKDAREDDSVKAVVLRVDSPGGSAVASDSMWREVQITKKKKPVVVSMGDVAASGGYHISMGASHIFAEPSTITGSIGVLGGKVLTSGAWDKLGISWDEVHTGKNATMWSSTSDYTPEGWKRFEAWLDRVYVDFTNKVAEGRKLPKARVLEIAKGRIWTGEDAKKLGLVDELGGFPTALALARKAARIPDQEEVRVEVFPRKKTTFEALIEQLSGRQRESSEASASTEVLMRTLQLIQPAARQVRGGAGVDGVLSMPELRIVH
jgi:protease-4